MKQNILRRGKKYTSYNMFILKTVSKQSSETEYEKKN